MSEKFYTDIDKNRLYELLLVDLLESDGIPAFLNDTPEPDDAPDEETRKLW